MIYFKGTGRACKAFREVWANQIAGAAELLHPIGATFASLAPPAIAVDS